MEAGGYGRTVQSVAYTRQAAQHSRNRTHLHDGGAVLHSPLAVLVRQSLLLAGQDCEVQRRMEGRKGRNGRRVHAVDLGRPSTVTHAVLCTVFTATAL